MLPYYSWKKPFMSQHFSETPPHTPSLSEHRPSLCPFQATNVPLSSTNILSISSLVLMITVIPQVLIIYQKLYCSLYKHFLYFSEWSDRCWYLASILDKENEVERESCCHNRQPNPLFIFLTRLYVIMWELAPNNWLLTEDTNDTEKSPLCPFALFPFTSQASLFL